MSDILGLDVLNLLQAIHPDAHDWLDAEDVDVSDDDLADGDRRWRRRLLPLPRFFRIGERRDE